MFNLYINDIANSTDCDVILFADDTNCILKHKELDKLENIANTDFFDANSLSINGVPALGIFYFCILFHWSFNLVFWLGILKSTF